MPTPPKSLILFAIWMTALAAALLWAAYLVRAELLLIYISGLLAMGFSPMVRMIERQKLLPIGTRRFPRWLAILVLYVVILGTLVGIGVMVIRPLAEQSRELWRALPDMTARAQQYLIDRGIIDHQMGLREAVGKAPTAGSADAVGLLFGAVTGVGGGLFGFLTILILTFYFLVESDALRQTMLRLVPAKRRRVVAAASRDITVKVSAWLGGQIVLGAVIGATTALALWLMGVPYFYVLALISAIGELIPVVGPILAALPALAVAATISFDKVVFVFIFFVIQQQFENHLLVPKLMERQVGVSAVTVIVALLIGGGLLGIVGAILAVPTAAILQVVITEMAAKEE